MPMPSEAATLPGLPERRGPTKGERRRESLLAALAGLLEERPLAEIGVGDITERAGVGRSAFYFYFASKEAAVTEVLRGLADEILGDAKAFLAGDADDPADAVREALAGTARAWVAHRHLVLAMLDAAAGDDEVRALWEQWMDVFRVPLTQRIADEQETGRATTAADPERLADVLLSMNERSLERHLRDEPSHPASTTDAVVDALTAVWLTTIYGGPR